VKKLAKFECVVLDICDLVRLKALRDSFAATSAGAGRAAYADSV
jgi:hypothetical protein